jgi:hypothetical protein
MQTAFVLLVLFGTTFLIVVADVQYVSDNVIRTYEEAVNNCTDLGGVLPTGRNKAEIDELRKWANTSETSFWLNGKEDDDGVYRWQDDQKDRIADDLWYEGHEPWCHSCCRVTVHFNDDINDGKLTAINCIFKTGFICVIRN